MKQWIRGIGLVTCRGRTLEAFWGSLNRNETICRPITDSFYPELNGYPCAEVVGFNPFSHFSEKELVNADRSTSLIAVAVKSALRDAATGESPCLLGRTGVANGTTLSIATSVSDFYRSVLREGPRHCKIASFPNTVMNAPAGRVAILSRVTGANTTVSSGICSGLDAIGLAGLSIGEGVVDAMICGGVEALSDELLLGYAKGRLFAEKESASGWDGGAWDVKGALPSEGAVALVMSRTGPNGARTRYGSVVGYSCSFAVSKPRAISERAHLIERTLLMGIEEAGIEISEVGLTITATGFDQFSQQAAIRGVAAALGESVRSVPILLTRQVLGDGGAVLGPQNVLIARGYFEQRLDERIFARLNSNSSWTGELTPVGYAAIVHVDPAGHNSVLIVAES